MLINSLSETLLSRCVESSPLPQPEMMFEWRVISTKTYDGFLALKTYKTFIRGDF